MAVKRRAPHTATEHYVALRRESAPRRWLLAVLVGGGVGAVVNLVLLWPLALLTGAATVAVLMIWDRRHGTIAGWWPGDHRPYQLAATASRLERHGWTALPGPVHSDETPLADYLLIGPGGVFVVDHQVWPPSAAITIDPSTRLLLVGGTPAVRRVISVKGAAATVAQALSPWLPDETVVHPVLTVDRPSLDRGYLVAAVTVLPIADLARFLTNRDPVLHPTALTSLIEQARQLFTQS